MSGVSDFIFNIVKDIGFLSTMQLSDVVDILIIALVIYECIVLVRRTNSVKLAVGLAILLMALWISEIFELGMVNSLLSLVGELGIIAIMIIFQPEIRRFIERMGSGSFAKIFISNEVDKLAMEVAITQTVMAYSEMAKTRTGALVVFERMNGLSEYASTGTMIDASVNSELMRNIFYNKAPLHDGALIVRDGRMLSAGCMLPLSQNTNLSRDLGMRHRAGIGMSEHSDAVIAIVSEETGSISVAIDGMLKRRLSPEMLEQILRKELMPEQQEETKRGIAGFKAILSEIKVKWNEEK